MLAVLTLCAIAGAFGVLLGYSNILFRVEGNAVAEKINQTLPQTQCGQCEFPGCMSYAENIAAGKAQINRCPPGGQSVINELAALLDLPVLELDESHGTHKEKCIALIDEQNCIGCTLCIQACPVDAIVGCAKQMHYVIVDQCTGCELCVPPCPVDCIQMPTRQTYQLQKIQQTFAVKQR